MDEGLLGDVTVEVSKGCSIVDIKPHMRSVVDVGATISMSGGTHTVTFKQIMILAFLFP